MGSVLGYDILTSQASRSDRTPTPPPVTPSPTQPPRILSMPKRKTSAAVTPGTYERHSSRIRERVNTNPKVSCEVVQHSF